MAALFLFEIGFKVQETPDLIFDVCHSSALINRVIMERFLVNDVSLGILTF